MRPSTLLAASASFALLIPGAVYAHPDPAQFAQTAFTQDPAIVECALEDGTQAECYEFTVAYKPDGLETGPFCPSNLAEIGGIWDWDGEEAGLYRLDRALFEMLAAQGYQFYDDNGDIAISDPGAGGRPDADHACLEASEDDTVVITMRLPVDPVMAETPTDLGTVASVGVALDGVPIFADAPSVLDTGHLPALDVCGGHIDPGGWYHWHGTSTDIETALEAEGVSADCALTQDASAQFGYAFDGFPMFGSMEADGKGPEGLDACGGHIGPTVLGETYHYHASESFPNLPACLVGVMAEDNFATTADGGIGAERANGGPQGGQLPPGFDEAAASLGVTAEALMQAIDDAGGREADLAEVAETLGVDDAALRDALPTPPNQ
ncbi:hypothetical protein DSM110093_02597 [Sulfitobacter sp. DSM 110093]|uniref:YHYH protein n=1 Tax=Sulfitobacter sp. DSM 110093 TaxID=2883127 RepID=UPI001FAB58C8|nr:YHYH protein [Sulfitobacter sp. DSM 110093]UOA32793.1 hypothetical protein DSM110093_02597 [Sulfitobacter sp. DSM 110093]